LPGTSLVALNISNKEKSYVILSPEEQPFSSFPNAGEVTPQNNLFNRPATSFPGKRPEGPRVKSNILANQRNKGGNVGNGRSRPKITLPAPEDPRSTGERVVPVNDLEPPASIPPGVNGKKLFFFFVTDIESK
jgi:hypothetical protein